MKILINPGSGPTENGTIEQSEINIKAFIKDMGIDAQYRFRKKQDDGRHLYEVYFNATKIEIEMPALELNQVRWMDSGSGNIFAFPRLYIEGSSWIWSIAIGIVKSDLTGIEE